MITTKEKTVCFTGHRELPVVGLPSLKRKLKKTIRSCIADGYEIFEAGGALGFDTLAAETVLSLKKTHPQIHLILILPCLNQTRSWSEKDIATYERIKEKADEVVYTSEAYTRGCMFLRNRRLVDDSSLCISYQTENKGGTAYTVNYALKKGIKVINLGRS